MAFEEQCIRTERIKRPLRNRKKTTCRRDRIDKTLATLLAAGALAVIGVMGYAKYEDRKLLAEYDSLPRTNIVTQAGEVYDHISARLVPTKKFDHELRQNWGMKKYGDLSLKTGESREYPYDPNFLNQR